MEEVLRQWGRNIKAGRKVLGMTQHELADAVGVRPASVCRWEAGSVAITDAHKVKVATVLHQDVSQLFPLMRVAA